MRSALTICKSLATFLEGAVDVAEAEKRLQQVQEGLKRVVPEGTIPKHRMWKGLRIDIENPKGTTRQGVGENGVPWSTYMFWDYGYIRKTEGDDGDEIDVYLGPDLNTAPNVYVIHQRKAPHFALHDEDKCMVGFPDESTAQRAYIAQYDRPEFFGTMETFKTEDFVAYVKKHKKAPGTVPDNYLTADKLMQRLLAQWGV